MTHQKFRINILIIAFIAVIAFPLINSNLHLVKDIASTENRKMQAKPAFDINLLDPFPAQYEKYYNDNFSVRAIMVKYFNYFNIKLFKKSPVPEQLIIGNNGWLFMAGHELDAYRGKFSFTESELEEFKLELEYRKKYLNDRGCQFYFLIAPIKANIYTDQFPSTYYKISELSWGEQLIDYLNKNSEVKPLNVYEILRANKDKYPLYHKIDNHWNELGGFLAANEVLKQIKKDINTIELNSLSDYTITKTENEEGNLANMLSNKGLFKDTLYQLIPKSGFKAKEVKPVGYPIVKGFPYPWAYEKNLEVPNSSSPRLLIISDSFGANIFPFLAENFSRSVKIFDSWQFKLNEDIVASEKPDVVIVIALESHLKNMLKHQSRLKK